MRRINRRHGYWAAALIAGLALSAGQAAANINFASDFTGDAGDNWGWASKTDPNGQLGGTNELTYTYAADDADAWLDQPISDTSIFPDGTGTVQIELTVDLSNYPTGDSDFTGPTLAEITSSGNKSGFNGGMIAGLEVDGFNNPGDYRFGHSAAVRFWGGGSSNTGVVNVGANPNFPLVYDVLWTVTISGDDATGWTIESEIEAEGPIDSSGTIGLLTDTTSFSRVDAGFDGWASATGYRVGVNRGGTATAPGDSITFDNFRAVPEPASLALIGLGGLMLLRRR